MPAISDEMKMAMPEPLFPCGSEWCAVETTHAASDLFWSPVDQAWMCACCADTLDRAISETSLEDCQKQVGWVNPGLSK